MISGKAKAMMLAQQMKATPAREAKGSGAELAGPSSTARQTRHELSQVKDVGPFAAGRVLMPRTAPGEGLARRKPTSLANPMGLISPEASLRHAAESPPCRAPRTRRLDPG
jgi:hypothetical protein